jgi:undecaprenyl-diphosphatase
MAVVAPVALVAGLILRRTRHSWTPLLVLAASIAGGSLLCTLIKAAVGRPRPLDALFHAGGYGFPSGHSTNAVTAWFTLAVLLGAASTRRARRVALLAGAVVIAAIVGVSRVYLRVHEATDVLGGWALGTLWVATVLTAASVLSRRAAL